MSEYVYSVTSHAAVMCNGTDCDRKVTVRFKLADDVNTFTARDIVEHEARARGWSRWHGRGVRWYCDDHGPKPGHKMDESRGLSDYDLRDVERTAYTVERNRT